MIAAFAKAVDQFSDSAIRRVLWISLGWTLAVFVALYGIVWYALGHTALFTNAWAEGVVDLLGAFAALGLTWLLFPAVSGSIIGLFLERVAVAVEARHYPGLPMARAGSLADGLVASLKLIAVMVVLNILALPLYLFPVINLLVFYGMNGYLLGREYFELAALRRMTGAEAGRLRKARKLRVFLSGVVIAFLLTLPVVNLLAPIIGTAAMVHLVEAWRPEGKGR
jgi:uncharacterized protein involved in cysteine biosynthesis